MLCLVRGEEPVLLCLGNTKRLPWLHRLDQAGANALSVTVNAEDRSVMENDIRYVRFPTLLFHGTHNLLGRQPDNESRAAPKLNVVTIHELPGCCDSVFIINAEERFVSDKMPIVTDNISLIFLHRLQSGDRNSPDIHPAA
jgi:hypothetical protein